MSLLIAIVIIILSPFLFVLAFFALIFLVWIIMLLILGIGAIFEMITNIFKKKID